MPLAAAALARGQGPDQDPAQDRLGETAPDKVVGNDVGADVETAVVR